MPIRRDSKRRRVFSAFSGSRLRTDSVHRALGCQTVSLDRLAGNYLKGLFDQKEAIESIFAR